MRPTFVYYPAYGLDKTNNQTHNVGVNDAHHGSAYLYSESFGPCIAVCAQFPDQSFALCHAPGLATSDTGTRKFVELCTSQNSVTIYLFQKMQQARNHENSFFLALNLKNMLPNAKIQIVPVRSYTAISIDATAQTIVLTEKLQDTKEQPLLKEPITLMPEEENIEGILNTVITKIQKGERQWPHSSQLRANLFTQEQSNTLITLFSQNPQPSSQLQLSELSSAKKKAANPQSETEESQIFAPKGCGGCSIQ